MPELLRKISHFYVRDKLHMHSHRQSCYMPKPSCHKVENRWTFFPWCKRKSQCHSWLSDYFGTLHVTGLEAFVFRHIDTAATSGPFTSSSRTISVWVSPPFFSSAGRGWFSGMVGAQMIKIGYIRPKAQQAAEELKRGGGRGGRRNESNERWQRIQIDRRRWKEKGESVLVEGK